jgi:putative restriction endonuclease
MAKLVLMYKAGSIYDDEPDTVYDFPKVYLKAVQAGVGDWIVYYEPVKAGARGYFAVARIAAVRPKPGATGRFLALIEPGSFRPFVNEVPRTVNGRPLEAALAAIDGTARSGGSQQHAVRRLPDHEFDAIVRRGLPADLEAVEARRYAPPGPGLHDAEITFERPVIERLTSRSYRDVAFRRLVRRAYDDRCAMSGLRLRNGGGRPEVQAAHIIPVDSQGSDSVRNGLALSGTLHWMFDRGLLSVADDGSILVSHNKVPSDVADRLLHPDRRLHRPREERDRPHPRNIAWHRENVFGQIRLDGPAPWD